MPDDSRILRIGEWRVDPDLDELSREGQTIRLEPRPMRLLLYLAAHAGRVVDVQQLLDEVWPNVIVTHGSVYQAIAQLRRILGDESEHPKYIENLPRRGYRLIAPVAPWVVRGAAATDSSPGARGFPQVTNSSVAAEPQLASVAPQTAATPLTERPGTPEFIVPPSLKETQEAKSPNVHPGIAATGAPASYPSATPPAPARSAKWGPLGWTGGILIIVVLLAASWAIVHYREASKPAERASSGTAPAAIHSLAVLPLENLSGDKEQEYFADGMTDALTTDLAQIGSLRVISRTSAMQFKGSKETLPQIGRDLQVDAVVEGTVARGENRVRVTAQLIEASSDHHLWARTYERDLKNVLALQDEIAQDITDQIRLKLTPKERSLLMQVHAVDPEAYDAYLRGLYWWNQLTVMGDDLEDLEKACDYFQKAVARDPSYALAYVGVAECLTFQGNSDKAREAVAFPDSDKAREAVAKALVLDPSLAEAHTTLATMKFLNDWDWFGAEAEHKQAIALNPNYAPAHYWYSFFLVAMGRLDEAMREIERARDLDPYSALITEWLGQVLYHARRYDDALRENRRGLEMHPDASGFYFAMADVYEQKKMFAEAFAARQQALSLQKDPRVAALGEAYRRSGYEGYLLKQTEFEQTLSPPYVAHIYALLHDEPRAIDALEAAYNKHFDGVLFLRTAPELDSIRSSPRFRELVRRIGFPPSPGDKD